ncbi:MAG: hypothetical protein HQ512_13215 [Rhodospirillales bacterium]|nr:hypothetical protein [Rhodospirillales bacterium]
MIPILRKFVFFVLPLFLLAACETPVKSVSQPELGFKHLGPLKLNVAKIDVVARHRPPLKSPYVEHLFPTPPMKAVQIWARDRLQAVGKTGTARLVINKASAIEVVLTKKTGLKAAFTKQQAFRYDLAIDATLELTFSNASADVRAKATRFSSVGEDASINVRNKIWFELTEALMADFNAEMEKNLRPFLVP